MSAFVDPNTGCGIINSEISVVTANNSCHKLNRNPSYPLAAT